MSPVLVRSDDRSTAQDDRRRHIAVTAVVAIAVAAMLAGLSTFLRGPARVDRITVQNRSPYVVDVEVTDGARDGWLGLAAARPQERVDVTDVVDQGDRWTFRFTSGPHDGGEVTFTRAQLERSGWRVTLPASMEARLGASGAHVVVE